jgi:hypothetical protein
MKKLWAILWLILTARREPKLEEVRVKSCRF